MPIFNTRNPIEYPLGLVEALASMASGAVGQIAGVPAGLLKSITSGQYGTQEGVQTAQEEANRIQQAMMYQPRTETAVQGMGLLGKALEASKIPPIMPELQPLGAMALQPKQAYVAQGMNIEKAIEPAVRATMQKGGLPAGLLEGMAQKTISPMDVWHGSAKTFDEFDSTKIGSGAGAQAYGYGHYFAENPNVSKGYVPRDMDYENTLLKMYNDAEKQRDYNSMSVLEEAMMHRTPAELRSSFGGEAEGLIKKIESIPQKGALYKVDLPDEQIARMVNWDEEIGKQSKAVQDLALSKGLSLNDLGGDLIAAMEAKSPAGAEAMRKAGIPGVSYMDTQYRTGRANDGRNFVVFPGGEDMLTMLERNGMAIPRKAPVSPTGFYSAVEQAAMNLKREKGPGQGLLNEIIKSPDVKKEELQAMGLLDRFGNSKPTTKQELLDYIGKNKVDFGETRLTQDADEAINIAIDKFRAKLDSDPNDVISAKFEEAFPNTDPAYWSYKDMKDELVQDYIDTGNASMDADKFGFGTRYQDYAFPGGKNYREILLTKQNPVSSIQSELDSARDQLKQITSQSANLRRNGLPVGDLANQYKQVEQKISELEVQARQEFNKRGYDNNYQSSHWDEPNVLAHIRAADHTDADGKNMMLVEEIQSDWHQAGRDKGYQTGKESEQISSLVKEYDALTKQRRELLKAAEDMPDGGAEFVKFVDQANNITPKLMSLQTKMDDLRTAKDRGVPDAPMKDTWYQMALKKAIKDAVDNGYDRVGLPTGAAQAERYDLSKHVDDLQYDSQNQILTAWDHSGNKVINEHGVPPEKLSSYIGKEGAQKLMEQSDPLKQLFGADLKVGGEGMKKYYDEVYPKFLDKFAKKYGSSVKETKIKAGEKDETVRYIDITPEMKKEFGGKKKGFPLFSMAAPVGAGGLLDQFDQQQA